MAEAWKRWEGQVVDGKFHLGRYLGGSEHSVVFLTERQQEPRRAAIKLVAVNPESASLQLAQWELAAGLSHPHLMRLFERGRCELEKMGLLYVVMEYAEEDLSKILPQRPLTAGETSQMLKPVLEAVTLVHAEGFVHGHIKPENILVVDEQIKISSDGLCKVGESSCSLGAPSMFHPPEAAEGKISPAADAWAIGMALVVTLTQRLPAWEAAGQKDPVLPETLPQPFLDIARHCLVRDPQRRWSIAQIVARLQAPAILPQQQPKQMPAQPEAALPPVPRKAAQLQSERTPAPSAQQPSAAKSGSSSAKRHSMMPVVVVIVLLVAILAGIKLLTRPARHQSAPSTVSAPGSNQSAPLSHDHPQTEAKAPAGQVVKGALLPQPPPNVPRRARNTIHGTIRVRVKADVDAAGKVVGATLESAGSSKYFAAQALKAAHELHFRPAQSDGQNIPSQWVLRFEFRRKGTKVVPLQGRP